MGRSARITIPATVFGAAMVAVTLWLGAPDYSSTFYVDATWYPDRGQVIITYDDMASATENVTLEVLGLSDTFHTVRTSSSFVQDVRFDRVPDNGWRAHPVVFDVVHAELGSITIKTEVHDADADAPPVIYGRSD